MKNKNTIFRYFMLFRESGIFYCLLLPLLLFSTPGLTAGENLLQQDQIVVSGVVTDESGSPLPGVNVIEQGTLRGIVTDASGQYSLMVAPDATLTFSFVGFLTAEIQV